MDEGLSFSVGEFVALLNQTLEFAYPTATITGEVANFKTSKGKWVYFDLKDESATVRFFGTVYQLPGPIENGMMMAVVGSPRLHPLYGFTVNVVRMRPVGEGSIKKAAQLLEAKLAAEGLFDADRKRPLPYPPQHIGLVASAESAAYKDFIKVLNARWRGVAISFIDVQVQGEASPGQVVAAIDQLNSLAQPPEVIVVTRGGGSAEDLQSFSTEQVTRAVAASRVPTIVAIGHEVDISLAELAADQRASTPSNAAELLVPDRRSRLADVYAAREQLARDAQLVVQRLAHELTGLHEALHSATAHIFERSRQTLDAQRHILQAYDPHAALQRGYAIVRSGSAGAVIRSGSSVQAGAALDVELHDAHLTMTVKQVTMKGGHDD